LQNPNPNNIFTNDLRLLAGVGQAAHDTVGDSDSIHFQGHLDVGSMRRDRPAVENSRTRSYLTPRFYVASQLFGLE
jgi:hypothetical protein